MPVPEGIISTSAVWSSNGEDNQTVEETAQENVSEETDTTEPEVVEGGSETEG